MLLLGEEVLTIFLCIKRVHLNWNFLVYDVQNTTYSSHGAPCPTRDLFPWLNTRVKVHISVWTIPDIRKRHSWYLSDSGDTFLPLTKVKMKEWHIPLSSLPWYSTLLISKQSFPTHARFSRNTGHALPPFWRVLMGFRFLFWFPSPQSALHRDQGPHSDTTQSFPGRRK